MTSGQRLLKAYSPIERPAVKALEFKRHLKPYQRHATIHPLHHIEGDMPWLHGRTVFQHGTNGRFYALYEDHWHQVRHMAKYRHWLLEY